MIINLFLHCRLEKEFLDVFPGLISPGSFLPLFPSLVDLPSKLLLLLTSILHGFTLFLGMLFLPFVLVNEYFLAKSRTQVNDSENLMEIENMAMILIL